MTTENPVDVPEVTDAVAPDEVVESPAAEVAKSKPTLLSEASEPAEAVQLTVMSVAYSPVDTFAASSAAMRATLEVHQDAIASAQDSAQKWMEQVLAAQEMALKAAQEAVQRAIDAVQMPFFKTPEN